MSTPRAMERSKGLGLVVFSLCLVLIYALDDEFQVINGGLGKALYDTSNTLYFDNREMEVTPIKGDVPTHTVTRVKRQTVTDQPTKIQGLTARQDCEGILLQWNKLNIPFSPKKATLNKEFTHFNIYRSMAYFDNVSGMKPHASLQNPDTDSYKDLYPLVNKKLYYAVTMVDGEGQEEKVVEATKVVFVGAFKATGPPFKFIPDVLRNLGKVLHHSTAWNPKRNEYLVAFDFDVDNDGLPDQLFALRLDTKGGIVNRTIFNGTTHINNKAGNQGWPTVAYNSIHDEYMILFQLRSGVMQYYKNKYVILSQRVMSSQTEAVSRPSVSVNAVSSSGSRQYIDVKNPIMKFNPATGGYVLAAVMEGGTDGATKKVIDVFFDFKGNALKGEILFDFKGSAYEPNIFLDSKRKEFYFTCTVESGGVAKADFNLTSGLQMIVLTKLNGTGAHASNTKDTKTENFLGYTSKTLAKTTGYYNELTDRLMLFWENTDKGEPFITTASVLLTRQRYIRDVKEYSCLATKPARTPAAVYFPENGNHVLVWQEQSSGSSFIGGELLQDQLQPNTDEEQKNIVTLYNSKLKGAFVTWQEDGEVLAREITMATKPLCSPSCKSDQTCVVQDTCVPKTGDSCTVNNGNCSNKCRSLRHWKVQCSCQDEQELMEDEKTCQSVPPCHGMTPVLTPTTKSDDDCDVMGCPGKSYCQISHEFPTGKCCPPLLPSYFVLVATMSSIWKLFVETKQNRATFHKLQIDNPKTFVALDYNPKDKRLYWSDVAAKTINRISPQNGEVEILAWKNIGVVDGLTVDAEGDILYWTDVTYQRIERANLNGKNRTTLLNGLDKPRAIVLYKARRLMYWTDWGAIPKIERSDLDGGNRRIIIQGDLKWPNGLVIDEASDRLFWAEAGLDKIETSDLLGRGRRVLLGAPHVGRPYSLAILNNRFFWSDWDTNGIYSVDKETGKDVMTIAQGLDRPSGFVVFAGKPSVYSKVYCPDPGNPLNGYRRPRPGEGSSYPQGAVIHYKCYVRFRLYGPKYRTCLDNGSWSEIDLECLYLPIFRTTPSNKTVEELQIAILPCSASSSDTNITWFKDGKPVTGDNFVTTRSGLLIQNVYNTDKGLYVCKATNKVGSKEAHAYLDVRETFEPDHECGRPAVTRRRRLVIGGSDAESRSHPWQVSLWDTKKKENFCGGSLVSKRWVVTAAHCFPGRKLKNIMVRLGKLNIKKDEPSREQKIRPERIEIHHQFSSDTYDSDVALIYLQREAIYTDYVKPICLPLRKKDADNILLRPGTFGVVTGWGVVSERKDRYGKWKKEYTEILQSVAVPVVDQSVCEEANKNVSFIVTRNMFCAGFAIGKHDACEGDSGGPLAIFNSFTGKVHDHRWVLAGVVSWGIGCGLEGKYGVYTRVSAFSRWINDHIKDDR